MRNRDYPKEEVMIADLNCWFENAISFFDGSLQAKRGLQKEFDRLLVEEINLQEIKYLYDEKVKLAGVSE